MLLVNEERSDFAFLLVDDDRREEASLESSSRRESEGAASAEDELRGGAEGAEVGFEFEDGGGVGGALRLG